MEGKGKGGGGEAGKGNCWSRVFLYKKQANGSLTARASGLTPFSIIDMQIDRVLRSSWQFCDAGQPGARKDILCLPSWRCRLTRIVEISWRMSTACWAAACFSLLSSDGILIIFPPRATVSSRWLIGFVCWRLACSVEAGLMRLPLTSAPR